MTQKSIMTPRRKAYDAEKCAKYGDEESWNIWDDGSNYDEEETSMAAIM